MKKILFWVEPNWALGSIHFELTKRLRPYGIDSYVFSWSGTQNVKEWLKLYECVDFIVTLPCAWPVVKDRLSFINPKKLILVAHARQDIEDLKKIPVEELLKFKEIGCVSNWLKTTAENLKLNRELKLVPLGINYNFLYNKPNTSLNSIGYAAFYYENTENQLTQQAVTKRSHIIKKLKETIPVKIANSYINSYISMVGFYKNTDAIICCSSEEGAGLPMLEAGAAGKLVLTTPVGHWPEKVGSKGSIELPLEENALLQKVKEIYHYYSNNPVEYYNKCIEFQEHAKTYDWQFVIEDWVKLIN